MAGVLDEWAAQNGRGKKKPSAAGVLDAWAAQHGINQPDPELLSSYADEPTPQKNGLMRELADTGLSISKGAVGAIGAIANIAGADNPVSQGLNTARNYLGTLESDEQQAQRKTHAERMAQAEATGSTWEEVKTAFSNFTEDPFDYAAEAAGSLVTGAPVRLISAGAKVAGVGGRTLGLAGIGATSGVGSVKGAQYEAVKAAKLAEGFSAEEAEAAGVEAQSYSTKNGLDLLTGGALGVLAGTTGAERVVGGIIGREGRGLVKRAVANTLAEGSLEGVQGGQERYAGNQALIRNGYDVNPWKGVAGQAVTEALMSAPGGAATGVMEGYTPTQGEVADQTQRETEARSREEAALVEAQQRAETERQEAEQKGVRDQNRAYYADQLPFEEFKKQRVAQVVDEQVTPEILETAYQEALRTAVEQEAAPPDRAKFEKQYKAAVKKEVAKSTDELTQEYYAELDNMAATGVDLMGDPTELNQTDETVDDSVDTPAAQPANRRQMDFLGELDRTVQPGYSPVMPVETPGTGAPQSTVFSQTPIDDSGLPGALQEAKARAAAGGVTVAPPNVQSTPLLDARTAALQNGVSKGAWAKFVSVHKLLGADQDGVGAAIRERAINGSGSNNSAWEAAHSAVTGMSIDEFLTRKENDDRLQNQTQIQTYAEEGRTSQEGNARQDLTLAQEKVNPAAVVVPELATQQNKVYQVLKNAAAEGDLDNFIASDGTINYQRIADKMGIPRQSAKAAIDQTVKRFERANEGKLRERLQQRAKAVRVTEQADEDMLGTSPDNFTKTSLQPGARMDKGDIFGDDSGADQSFGIIQTAGGSQSGTDAERDVSPSATELAKPDPVSEKRREEAAARNAAMQAEALMHPAAGEAAADWDDMRGEYAPFAKDLSRQDAYDWLMNYMEWKHGDITEETLAADQLDIERRYDADPAKAAASNRGDRADRAGQPALVERSGTTETPAQPDAQKDAPDADQGTQDLVALEDIPKGLKITLEKDVEGKTKRKTVDARRAMLAAQQRVEKLTQLRKCLG